MVNVLWDRYAKVTFTLKNGDVIEFERYPVIDGIDLSPDFEVESTFDTTENSNICKITLFNLPMEIIKKLTVGIDVIVEAGYMNGIKDKSIGVIYKGIIENCTGKVENANKKYEITCNTYNDEYKDTKINLRAGRGTKASTLIKLIISKLDKLKAGKIELTKDVVYKDGKTLHNNVKSIFKTIAKDCESVFFIRDGIVNFQKKNDINLGTIEFDPKLFQDITSNQDGYTLKSVFDHRLQEGYKLKIEEKDEYKNLEIKGEFLIIKGKHFMSFKSDAFSEIEIRTKLEGEENKKEIEIITNKKTGKKNGSKKKTKKKKNTKKKGKKKDLWQEIVNKYKER